jgi:hypothetical protein
MVDIPLPPIGRPRWRIAPEVRAPYYVMMRAMLVAILLSIGWSAALSLSEALQRCDTAVATTHPASLTRVVPGSRFG